MRTPRLLLVALSLLGISCAIHLDGQDWYPVHSAIERVGAEVNVHYAHMTDVASMTAARGELDRHERAMRTRLDEVRWRVEDSGCGATGGMYGALDEAELRLEDYLDETSAMPTVTELRDACDRYGDDMDLLLGRMMSRWGSLWCP